MDREGRKMVCFHGISQSWRIARDVNESLKEVYKIDCDMLKIYIQNSILKNTTPKFNTEVC